MLGKISITSRILSHPGYHHFMFIVSFQKKVELQPNHKLHKQFKALQKCKSRHGIWIELEWSFTKNTKFETNPGKAKLNTKVKPSYYLLSIL